MAQLTQKEQEAMRSMLAKMAFGIIHLPLEIKPAGDGQLGYTMPKENSVYVAFEHPYYDDLKKYAVIMFIEGVYGHEVMHRCYTNFPIYTRTIRKKPPHEQQIMSDILNVMEDSAIEYHASEFMGDHLVRCIDFMRSQVFRKSQNVEEFPTAFGQFFSACIMYGDAGKVKGTFTFDEAERIFKESVPLMDACTLERNPSKRASLCEQVFELSRPLWEEEAKDAAAFEKLLRELEEMHGTGSEKDAEGSFEPIDGESYDSSDADGESSSGSKSKESDGKEKPRRMRFVRRGLGSSDPSDGGETKSSDASVSEETASKEDSAENGKPDAHKSEDDSKESEDSEKDSDSDRTPIDNAESEEASLSNGEAKDFDGEPSSEKSETDAEKDVSDKVEDGSSSRHPEPEFADDDAEDFFEPTDEDIEQALKSLKEAKERMDAKEDATADDLVDLDQPVSPGYCGVCDTPCFNFFVQMPNRALEDEYDSIVRSMSNDINRLTNQLERILKRKQSERVYRSSGQLNVKRLSSARMTPYVFTRRKEPQKADLSVVVAVDISGSMRYDGKIPNAMKCSIGLAEVFGKLKIPIYIFGFSADEYVRVKGKKEQLYSAVHFHYINWSNRKSERLRLLSMKPRANNFDGYAIRYGGSLLKTTSSEDKLLIVVSDGLPQCYSYDEVNGITDTQLAVKEVSKFATVIGVLLGYGAPEVHRQLYGYNFIDCKNSSDLFQNLGKAVARFMKD